GLKRVGHAGAVVVAGGIDEDLRLALQAAKRLRVENPVAVTLERRAQPAVVLVAEPAASVVRAHGERREPLVLELADSRFVRVRDSSRDLRHRHPAYWPWRSSQVSAAGAGSSRRSDRLPAIRP